MKFSEIVKQTVALLQDSGRVSYRALKMEFNLDDNQLDALKDELTEIQELAADKDGKMLVWLSKPGAIDSVAERRLQSPASYTPSHLAERIRAEQAALEARGVTDGERKTITALFADLKGSTALIEGLDPEDARAMIDPALQLMMDAVHQYDGYVAQALGDGIFALFGAPLAHEDHPQRAVYAALRMKEAMGHYADTLRSKGHPPLQMRVGLNTGEVVVRSIRKDDLHTDYVPVGHSTNLAARMEQLANPGTIVVSAHTHRLTDGYFAFKDLGPTQIKGVEEPLNIYEVLSVGSLRTRLQVSARRGLTRFVGRQSEMAELNKALALAKAGQGQIVGVMGEPGLGKSRLFYEFKLLSVSGCLVLEANSVSYGKTTAYLPVIELLKSYFRIEPSDDERTRREKVTGKVLNLDRSLEDALPYLFALLGIEAKPSPLQQMDAEIRRSRTFDALKRLFLRESLNQPLVLVFEDLHWIDGETQGLLDALGESVAGAQLLLLTNYRPEYRHEWGQKTYYTQLRLAPLGEEEAEELLTFLLGSDTSLTSVKALILEKTQGTPFFMEEVVQTLAEDGTLSGAPGQYRPIRAVSTLQLPATVQAILAARIDRLAADEKALLQQLSVIGREFPLSLVRQVVTEPESEVYRLLGSLQHKEFLYEQPAFPEVEYIFKHALTQEVAYGTVLQEQRKALHEKTAEALEVLYADSLDDRYSALAHHYCHSENTAKAVEYLGLVGQQAAQRSANEEAIHYLTQAVDILSTLAETPARIQQELMLQTTLGSVFVAAKGYTALEINQTYVRARQLCQQLGDTGQLIPVLAGQFLFHGIRAEHQLARELAEECLRLSRQTQDSAHRVTAHYMLGQSLLWLGEIGPAQHHSHECSVLYEAEQHHALAALYGEDPGGVCLGFEAHALFMLGFPDQALQKSHEAIALAQELGDSFTLAQTLALAAWVRLYRREAGAAQAEAERAITVSREHEFPYFLALGTIQRGAALTEPEDRQEAILQMRQGLVDYRAAGAEFSVPFWLARLATGLGTVGQIEGGLLLLTEARALVETSHERWHEAEIYRLKGELLLQQSHEPQAEAQEYFHKALAVARQQEAKSWELRAATSLARLWQKQGKQIEAQKLLSEIYNWFTEGFDTKDLEDAKALMEELG